MLSKCNGDQTFEPVGEIFALSVAFVKGAEQGKWTSSLLWQQIFTIVGEFVQNSLPQYI